MKGDSEVQFRLRSLLIVTLLVLAALVGCEVVRDRITPSTDTDEPDMASSPVKIVWTTNYPLGGKDAYLAWAASVLPTLSAPKELKRLAAYDNLNDDERPHRLVEFEFDSFADAANYLQSDRLSTLNF